MPTENLNGDSFIANSIVVTDNLGGGDYNYLINIAPGSGTADDLVINGGTLGDQILLGGLTAFSGVVTLTVNANGGADTVVGSALGDVLNGGDGNDSLSGGAGDDTIAGDTSASFNQDVMLGQGGNDVFLLTASQGQGDIFDGGADTDTLRNIQGQTTSFSNVGDANFISIEVLDGSGGSFNGDGGDNLLDFSAIATAVNVSAINGAIGNDTIVSVAGSAVFIDGGSGMDSILGNGLGESLDGGADADTLDGSGGNDTLRGGAGADSLVGGLGNDQFRIGQVDGQGDVYVGGSGADTVVYENGGQVVRFLSVGDANFLGIEAFNAGGQVIVGDGGANLLDFSAIATAVGVARIDGDAGADTIVAFGGTAVIIDGGSGADSILGNGLGESLVGGGDADTINGGAGHDTLRGGDGVDSLLGGLGNDQFRIGQLDGRGDVFVGGLGTDTIVYENPGQPLGFLTIGDANFIGIDVFDAGVQVINGDGGANLLDFSAIATAVGVTRIDGDAGNDTIAAFGATAVLINAGGGNDLVTGNIQAELLNGDAGADTIAGGGGADTIDGGADADRLAGGGGDDLYLVTAGDVITEVANGGRDTVAAGVTWVLGAQIEDLVLTGGSPTNGTGNTLGNGIVGNGGANTLNGVAGDDTLDGGAGIDRLIGGADNDLFIVTSGDVVVEGLNAGSDTVQAATNVTLGANVEVLRLTGVGALIGTGNTLGNLLLGGDGADTLNGGAGNDTLEGGIGADRLLGGAGDDLFLLRAGDVVVEGGNLGTDTVTAFGVVNVVLAANVEVLVMRDASVVTGTGNASGNTLLGNGLGNTLSGLGGADVLDGNAGNDTLVGGLGADTLDGGAGADRYVYNTTTESTLAATDRIEGFGFSAASLFDRVDLRGIDANPFVAADQAFIYRGAGFFSAIGPLSAGELRVVPTGPGLYRVLGDTNGDGTAEFAIDIASAAPATPNWFLL